MAKSMKCDVEFVLFRIRVVSHWVFEFTVMIFDALL